MPLIAMSYPESGALWTEDGHRVQSCPSVLDFVGALPGPTVIACDGGLYMHDRGQLTWLQEELARDGHTLIGIPPAALDVLAAAAGVVVEPDDPTCVFRSLALGSNAVDHRVAGRFDWHAVRAALDAAHTAATAGAVESRAQASVDVIGPYATLDPAWQPRLGDGADYAVPLLDAIWRAATAASRRDTFEKLLTLTEAPSPGGLSHTVRGWYRMQNDPAADDRGEPRFTRSAYRKALRWAYGRIHAARSTDAAATASPAAA